MKAKLNLPTGSLGIRFLGVPPAVKSIKEDSPLAGLALPGMVVLSIQVPGEVEITGKSISTTTLGRISRAFANVPDRTLTLEDRAFVEEDYDGDTRWQITLPLGDLDVTFEDLPRLPTVMKVSELSPMVDKIEEGLQVESLIIPGVGEFSDLTTNTLVRLLKDSAFTDGRILVLRSKPTEVRAGGTETNEHRYDFCASTVVQGHEAQMATVRLLPGQKVVAQPGAMVHMSEGIQTETTIGAMVRRVAAGERLGMTAYTYESTKSDNVAGTVAFAPDFPSKIFAINLDDYGGRIIAGRGAFVFGDARVQLFAYFPGVGTGLFGGEGLAMQRLVGQGNVFLAADGVIIQRKLKAGERIRVSSGNIAAYEIGVKYELERIKGFKNIFFGGEGLFTSTLTGPGTVWLESQPWMETFYSLTHRGSRLPVPL